MVRFQLTKETRGVITVIQIGGTYLSASCPEGIVEVPDELEEMAKAHPDLEPAGVSSTEDV